MSGDTHAMDRLADLEALGVTLGGRPVLRDVELMIGAGDVLGVFGPNGSGKTTLIRVLATLLRPDSGRGSVLGAELAGSDIYEARRSIGLIGHLPALIPELSLEENLLHLARLADLDETRIDNALEVVGLESAADRPASESSFGMKRRIEVAYLLLARPKLILLDEATSGLDSSAAELIDAMIDRTKANGGGAVLVSHDKSSLSARCSRLLQLGAGRLEPAA